MLETQPLTLTKRVLKMASLFDFPSQIYINEVLQNSFLSHFYYFFLFLGLLDTIPFYLIVCGLLRMIFPEKLGSRYVYLLSFILFSSTFLKSFFDMPRPGFFNAALDIVPTGLWGGFPSGAAMGASAIAAIILRHVPSLKGQIFAFFYLFLICLSRVYLGAHFLVDVFGGLFFGALVWFGLLFVEKGLDHLKNPIEGGKFVFASTLGLILMYLVHPVKSITELVLMLAGYSLGLILVGKARKPVTSLKNILIMLVGLFASFGLTEVPIPGGKFLGLVLIGLWVGYGCFVIPNKFSQRVSS